MRIALWLLPKQQATKISLNYHYPLSAAIYKILRLVSPVYADFLHDQGCAEPSGRLMKLFTFSTLSNPGARRRDAILVARAGNWHIASGQPHAGGIYARILCLGYLKQWKSLLAVQGGMPLFRLKGWRHLAHAGV